jgi:outer membrane biosynthesis protein TonB
MRRPIRLLLPALLLAAAALACNRGRDNHQEPTPSPDALSSKADEAADQVEALLDELETKNAQADPLEDVVEESVQEAETPDAAPAVTPTPAPISEEPPPTESANELSPESEEMLSTLEALVGELEGLNAEGDPLDDLP